MYNTVITIRFSFSHNFFSLVIIIMQGNKVSGQVCSIMNAVTSGVARIWKFCRPMAEQVPKVQAPVRKRCGVIASRRVREHASLRNFLKLRFCVFLFNVMKILFFNSFFYTIFLCQNNLKARACRASYWLAMPLVTKIEWTKSREISLFLVYKTWGRD